VTLSIEREKRASRVRVRRFIDEDEGDAAGGGAAFFCGLGSCMGCEPQPTNTPSSPPGELGEADGRGVATSKVMGSLGEWRCIQFNALVLHYIWHYILRYSTSHCTE
jgi:hypothetical protein